MQLLLACAHARTSQNQEEIRRLAGEGLDWKALVRAGEHHGMMPHLYYNLRRAAPEAVPASVMEELQRRFHVNARHSLHLTRELLRLLDLFEDSGIEAIPFKGPSLAAQIFGDISLRTFGDLDIIVLRQSVLQAKAVLQKDGYLPEVRLTPAQERLFLNAECEYNFNHPGRGARVEVHWRMAPSCYAIPEDEQGMWSRKKSLRLEEKTVSALCSEDLLVALCIHGARHNWGWNQLKLICDLAALLESHDIDWEWIRGYSTEKRIERIVLLGLKLAGDVLGAPLPPDVARRIEGSEPLGRLAGHLWETYSTDQQDPSRLAEEIRFWYSCREDMRDKVACILRLALEPSSADWMNSPLPVQLYPLYYLIHPARLIMSYAVKPRM